MKRRTSATRPGTADSQLSRAYDRIRHAIGAPAEERERGEPDTTEVVTSVPAGAIPVGFLDLDSRLLLRFLLERVAGGRAMDHSFDLASRFTRQGATILDLQEIEAGIYIELLATVEQAMFVLARAADAPGVFERWLRGAGYTGDVRAHIQELVERLRSKYAAGEAPGLLPASIPLDPRRWN